ncbi:MAG: site-specific integrase [Sedimentisphaerales bacterium]|nr:site-specific integrase [Sedimentisphaerales bacterium]
MTERSIMKISNKQPAPIDWLNTKELVKIFEYVCDKANKSRVHGEKMSWEITNEMLVLLLAETGIRAKEATNLRLEDLPCCHGYNEIKVTFGKNRYSRTIRISEFLAEKIKAYAGQGCKPEDFFLKDKSGKQLSYVALTSRVMCIGLAAKVRIYRSNGQLRTLLSLAHFRRTYLRLMDEVKLERPKSRTGAFPMWLKTLYDRRRNIALQLTRAE